MTTSTSDASVSEASSVASAGRQVMDEENGRILSAKYLDRSKGKKDLIQRLRKVYEVLREDETIEPDSPEYPGLATLCHSLLNKLDHRDKQVRLYAVCACMELFCVYAPDAPWSTEETVEIFRQTIRQLANLAHTTSPTSPHFGDYARILDLLSEIKIAVILVEMTKEEDGKEEALPVLADLFRTLLQSVRTEHPPEISEMAQNTIIGCFEEYHDGIMLPIPLLDEILLCIGQGPRVLVVNPQKAAAQQQIKKHKRLPAHQVEQTNPSYLVASSVIRSSVDRLSTPIASLLNGLLNNDPRVQSESSISTQLVKEISKPQTQDQDSQADVFNIIYELHRVAPSILTTVIGTLTNFLEVSEVDQRKLVVQLLGKLFIKPKFAKQFSPCYRKWLERAKDRDVSVRLLMINHLLLLIIPNPSTDDSDNSDVSQEAQVVLKGCLDDPSSEIRLPTIHGICDTAFRHPTAVSLDTWLAAGMKISCRQKQERKDALTGLVQTYFHHFMAKRLKEVQAGGDDVGLEVVQKTLEASESFNDKHENDRARFEWIPSRVFEAASFKDDTELLSRIWQAMDDMLLGSDLSSSASKKLTATARAVGLAMIVDNLEENATAWLGGLFNERARLQQKLKEYLRARKEIREYPVGSEEHLTANANALDLLEAVAAFTEVSSGNAGERNPILEKLHAAKDQHIFRIMSTIATPTHSSKSRIRAFDELPKRVQSQGEAAIKLVKGLVRKCAMGDFLNQEVVHHCILLAQECGMQDNWDSCRKFLKCVQLAADHFPDICANAHCFQNLSELFSECQASKEKGTEDVVTILSAILAKAASRHEDGTSLTSGLQKDLLKLCRDGAPEQARHAVQTLTATVSGGVEDKNKRLQSILDSIASPSNLSSSAGKRIVSVLAALAELAEACPTIMSSGRGQKAIKFAFESILLGRGKITDEAGDSDSDGTTEEQVGRQSSSGRRSSTATPAGKRSGKTKHLSPAASKDLLDDNGLSLSCKKLCAAIEYLTSYTRASMFTVGSHPNTEQKTHTVLPSLEITEKLFETLSDILRDGGMPPSNHDRKLCSARQDRAALRQCASVSLLRLCDPRLLLEQKFLTTSRWHVLAGVFLDDERVVRDRIIEELGLMLTGHGKFGKCPGASQAMVPRFNFLALVALCTDGDHSGGSNGNAANVGKRSHTIKMNALACVSAMRSQFEVESEQARANGPDAEAQFERSMKVRLMPEYVVPYMFHLLCFRRETPHGQSSTSNEDDSEDDDYVEINENQDRMLKKRLRWVFDPLVHSLGETADNISFLMRMSATISRFAPVANSGSAALNQKAASRLKAVCESSRAVLMSYVKKDVNLATFPGQIMVPGSLFRKASKQSSRSASATSTLPVHRQSTSAKVSTPTSAHDLSLTPDKSQRTSPKEKRGRGLSKASARATKRSRQNSLLPPGDRHDANNSSRVHFSPEVSTRQIESNFGDLSPIDRKLSMTNSPSALLDSGEKTRGSTPPSAVRYVAFTATQSQIPQALPLSASVTQSPTSKGSDGRRSLRSRNTERSVDSDHLQPLASYPEHGAAKKVIKEKSVPKKQSQKSKTSVPTQIKVFRQKPPAKIALKRKSDGFEFDDIDGPPNAKVANKTRLDKENNTQPKLKSTRGRLRK